MKENIITGLLSFAIVEFGLVVLPLLFYEKRNKINQSYKPKHNPKVIIAVYIYIFIALILWYFDLSFYFSPLDNISLVIIYFGYLYPSVFVYSINNSINRNLLKILLFTPVIAGIIFGILGSLGVMLGVLNEIPEDEVLINENYYYKEYFKGGALADEDFREIRLFKSIKYFTFLDKEVLNTKIPVKDLKNDKISVVFRDFEKEYKIKIFNQEKLVLDTLIYK